MIKQPVLDLVRRGVVIPAAPFDRYGTVDVVRAVADAGRQDTITLYTGNDDSILYDLATPFDFGTGPVRIRGGLLGQWGCWTKTAVDFLHRNHAWWDSGEALPRELLTLSAQITDANAAIFDARHQFSGSIPGVNEVLRRQPPPLARRITPTRKTHRPSTTHRHV